MKTRISLDTYLEQMQPHIEYAIKDGSNQARIAGSRGVLLGRDDLAQEARIKLVKIYERYARRVSVEDLGKIGTRCIRNRVQDLCRAMDSVKAGGVGDHVRRGRSAGKSREVHFYSLEGEPEETGQVRPFDHPDSDPSPLENAAVREALAKLVASLSAIEQRAIRAMFSRSEFEPAKPLKKGVNLSKLKDRVRETIQNAL